MQACQLMLAAWPIHAKMNRDTVNLMMNAKSISNVAMIIVHLSLDTIQRPGVAMTTAPNG